MMVIQQVAFLVAEEFWSQGDAEKSELSLHPAPLMRYEARTASDASWVL